MAIPGVPKGTRRRVIEAFIGALETSPQLANGRAIKTWLRWDGRDKVAPPGAAEMPAIEIQLLAGPVKRVASARAPGGPMSHIDVATPTVVINLWTRGHDQGDLADVAELVYAALAPQDDGPRAALQERFRKAGIRDWQLAREIGPASPESFTQECIAGSGAYQLTVQVYS